MSTINTLCSVVFFLCLVSLCGLVFFFLRLQSGGRGGAVGGRLIKEEPAAACSQPFWRKAFNTAARQRSKPLSRHWEGDSITILLEPPCLKPSQKKEKKKPENNSGPKRANGEEQQLVKDHMKTVESSPDARRGQRVK